MTSSNINDRKLQIGIWKMEHGKWNMENGKWNMEKKSENGIGKRNRKME